MFQIYPVALVQGNMQVERNNNCLMIDEKACKQSSAFLCESDRRSFWGRVHAAALVAEEALVLAGFLATTRFCRTHVFESVNL